MKKMIFFLFCSLLPMFLIAQTFEDTKSLKYQIMSLKKQLSFQKDEKADKFMLRDSNIIIYAQKTPPVYAHQYDVKRYKDKATFYFWYEDGNNYLRVVPQVEFFVCESDFHVLQNGLQYKVDLIRKSDEYGFCDTLYIPTTFRVSSPKYGTKFNDTIPIEELLYESEDEELNNIIYHFTPGLPEEQNASYSSEETSCIPLITSWSDPKVIKSKIIGKSFPIKGYYIHYGERKFDWLYIPFHLGSVYKLEKGITKDYSLRWLKIEGVTVEKQNNTLKFGE